MAPDPYRILGLRPGATTAEIKRAYRALAKANHPDSAGERALPRFLAIQAAYEQLATPKGSGAGSGRTPRTRPGSEPWRAEPDRAQEARRRARPAGRTEASGSAAGSSDPAGPARRSGGPAAGSGSAPRAGGGAPTGEAPGDAAPGRGASAGGQRRRTTRKATFGSTSYDEARDTSDPTWQGAAWYGQSSGEFWTVNPREYADPRKHGPEYQSRAADRAERARSSAVGAQADDPGRPATDRAGTTAAQARAQARARTEAASARAQARTEAAADAARAPAGATGPEDRADVAGRRPPAAQSPESPDWPDSPDSPDDPTSLVTAFIPSLDLSILDRSPFRRVLLALLAWPPLGIAAAAVIGESTGCAAFSATCTPEGAALPWVAQAVIVFALLAVPFVARVLIGGTAAVLIVAFPAAATLSASGARYDRAYGPASLLAILAIAWVIGVAFMGIRAARNRSRA